MGLFDIPAPLFLFVDNSIGFLPALLRLLIWGVLGGVLSILCYGLLSPQKRISEVKVALRKAQGLLASSDDSFAELWSLITRTLSLSLKHLMLVFIPALLSSLPLIFLLVWASSHYGYELPKPGERVSATIYPESAAQRLVWAANAGSAELDGSTWIFSWPAEAGSLQLSDDDGNVLIEIPPAVAIPQIHQRTGWNNWLGNPLGYLPQRSPVESIILDLPEKHFLSVGPAWFRGWMAIFFMSAMFSAVISKWLFKIH